jgi:HSP20 family molecular chaperone IbpA
MPAFFRLLILPKIRIITEKEIVMLADIPGVNAEGLVIDLRDDVLSIAGEVEASEMPGEQEVLTEYKVGSFYRQFTLAEMVEQDKIYADLKNGVLRLALPKAEKAIPRRISVS